MSNIIDKIKGVFFSKPKIEIEFILQNLGYSTDFINRLGSNKREKLIEGLKAQCSEKQLCFYASKKQDISIAIQIANSMGYKNISLENFTIAPGLLLKLKQYGKTKNLIPWGSNVDDCLYVYNIEKPNCKKVLLLDDNEDDCVFFANNISAKDVKRVEKAYNLGSSLVGFSSNDSILNGFKNGFRIFKVRPAKKQTKLSESDLQQLIFSGNMNFDSFKSILQFLQENKSALTNAPLPAHLKNTNIDDMLSRIFPLLTIMCSMTSKERKKMEVLSPSNSTWLSRVRRISRGCGTDEQTVSQKIQQMLRLFDSLKNKDIRNGLMSGLLSGDPNISKLFK